jgi:hypothetical protein
VGEDTVWTLADRQGRQETGEGLAGIPQMNVDLVVRGFARLD